MSVTPRTSLGLHGLRAGEGMQKKGTGRVPVVASRRVIRDGPAAGTMLGAVRANRPSTPLAEEELAGHLRPFFIPHLIADVVHGDSAVLSQGAQRDRHPALQPAR